MTPLEKIQLAKQVDRILHVPGNVVKGQQLEMAFVLDCSCNKEFLKANLSDAVSALKSHDRLFQNVRSNVVYWRGDTGFEEEQKTEGHLKTKTMPMSFLQTNKPFEEETFFQTVISDCAETGLTVENPPIFDELCAYLKMYHARSKCILVFTSQNYRIEDQKKVVESLNPFLKSKLLLITVDKIIPGTIIHMEMLRQTC